MAEIYWAPNRVERRAYRCYKSTLTSLPAINWPRATIQSSEPLKHAWSRESLIQLLDEQIELSITRGYSLSLVLAEFQIESKSTAEFGALLHSVARISNLMLRPTDIVVRYGNKSLALVLHECTTQGAHRAVTRLSEQLSRGIGKHHIQMIRTFGFAANLVGESQRAETVLDEAEASMWAQRVQLVK